jgi:DNA-binding transcriptional LysR family regulator
MKIDVLGVQAFVALAEHGSFRKAAGSLFITQTALTRRLQNLEHFLGVRLVERTTRSVALSPLGENFLPQARRLLSELQASLQEIRETGRALRGDLTLACVPTVGVQYLPRVIQAYSARHPDNRIRVLDHASVGVEQAVLRREAEFGIGLAGPHHAELESELLLQDELVLVCRDGHALATRRRVRFRELLGETLIFPGAGSSNRPLLDAKLAEAKVPLVSHFEVQRSSTAVGLVAAGVGMAVVPSLAMQPGAYPGLRVVALHEPVITRGFVLLTRRGGSLSPAAQALVDLIRRDAKNGRRPSR